jgi:hypothetical protein
MNVLLAASSGEQDSAETPTNNLYHGGYGAMGACSAATIGFSTLISVLCGMNA